MSEVRLFLVLCLGVATILACRGDFASGGGNGTTEGSDGSTADGGTSGADDGGTGSDDGGGSDGGDTSGATGTGGSTTTGGTTTTDGETTTGDETTSDSTDTGGGCADQCVPNVPGGWTGPISMYDGAVGGSPPACVGDYPDQVASLNGELDEGASVCDCDCDGATGISCSNGTLRRHEGQMCLSIDPPEWDLTPGVCTSLGNAVSGKYNILGVEPSGGSCAENPTENLGPAAWTRETVACGGVATTGDCGPGQLCVPAPGPAFEPDLCVYASGDVSCPANYTSNRVRYSGLNDGRSCTTCTCGDPTSDCNHVVHLTDGGCGGGSIIEGEISEGDCGGPWSPEHAQLYVTPTGTCEPTGGVLQGSVSLQGAVTFCCLP